MTCKEFYIDHPDHLGSPRAITRPADNALVWSWLNVDPFGNNVPDENPSGLGTFTCNLRFPGQYYDRETGTNYNTARDYDPAIGRYVQSDPIGLKGGVSTYGYVKAMPLLAIDSFGLASVLPPLTPDKALDGLVKDRGPAELGMFFGEACAAHCTRMTNPRRSPSEVATEICDELLPPLYIGKAEGHKIMLGCRSQCLKRYEERCAKTPTACLLSPSFGS